MNKIDYVLYQDTDSNYISLEKFILNNIEIKDNWLLLEDEKKIEYIKRISTVIDNYINDRTYKETQLIDYNSQVHDFKIEFEQEMIAKSALFIKKKKYACWYVDSDGEAVDEIAITGLEIIRSETPEAIREKLRDIMDMILRQKDDKEIQKKIEKYTKELQNVLPEEISANITVNNVYKYIENEYDCKKGTPWHVKGVANYRRMLHELKIVDKYEDISEGSKTKVIYVKTNPYGAETISFIRWPKEFNDYLQIDYDKMIENFFLNKINTLLKPMNRENLLQSLNNKGLQLFFGV